MVIKAASETEAATAIMATEVSARIAASEEVVASEGTAVTALENRRTAARTIVPNNCQKQHAA